jgi:hypothetical protein
LQGAAHADCVAVSAKPSPSIPMKILVAMADLFHFKETIQ